MILTKLKIGNKYGAWTVISEDFIKKDRRIYKVKCQCSCGTVSYVIVSNLYSGGSTNCGCWKNRLKVGDKVGKLLIVKELKSRKRGLRECECVCECGTIKITTFHELQKGCIKSCGCLLYERKGKRSLYWQGFGDISKSFYNQIVYGAKERNIKFDVSMKYLWELFLKQNKKCALSGILLNFSILVKDHNGTASLDRINSDKGYVVGNVQWVHKEINMMKNSHTQEHFFELCKTVVNNLERKENNVN